MLCPSGKKSRKNKNSYTSNELLYTTWMGWYLKEPVRTFKIQRESQSFTQGLMIWAYLDIFGIYVRHSKKHQYKHYLRTHNPKMTNAVPNFHPASCISDLPTMTITHFVHQWNYLSTSIWLLRKPFPYSYKKPESLYSNFNIVYKNMHTRFANDYEPEDK